MTSFHVTRLLLSLTCFIHTIVLCACASATYHPSEPTATLSLVRDPEDPSNRYSLQVSTDQINHYLKTLSNVPSSIYDSAHIITDFDESTISGAYSRAPSSSSSSSSSSSGGIDTKYTYEEAPRTSDKANLYHESHYGSESNVYSKKTSPNIKLYDEVDFGSSRITANPRALRTVILGGREYILRKDETGQTVATPSSSASASSSSSSSSSSSASISTKDLKDDASPAKSSSPAIVISESKPVTIEIGQKPASNEYPPTLPSNNIRTTFGLPRDTISKEKSEADLEREKDEQNAMEKVQDDLMKELYSIQKHTLNSSPVSNEAIKESDSPVGKDSNNKNQEVDLKTVQSLLTTLIKQIEQIQSVAKSLPMSSHSQTGGEEVMQYVKEYVPMRSVYKEARPIESMPLPYEIRGKKVDMMSDDTRSKKGYKHHSHHNPEEHQDIFLKAPDLVKMLTGESFEPSEYIPMPQSTSVNSRFMPMPLSLPNFPMARSSPAFSPFSYPMSFPSFPFYPGYKK